MTTLQDNQGTHDKIEDINKAFESAWEANKGREQTQYFMQLILENSPLEIKNFLLQNPGTILDMGCALGDGCHLLKQHFPACVVSGVDPSSVAIEKAKNLYKDQGMHFGTRELNPGHLNQEWDRFDYVFCSNVLEHFSDPWPYFDNLLSWSKQYCFILVPHNEVDRIPGHRFTFTDLSFPGQGKVFSKVIHCGLNPYWGGDQLLVIYKTN